MKNSVEIIKDIRANLGLSQHQLGNILGISRDIVAGWENNRARVPGDMLLKAQELERSTAESEQPN